MGDQQSLWPWLFDLDVGLTLVGTVVLAICGAYYLARWKGLLRPVRIRPNRVDAITVIGLILLWWLAGAVGNPLAAAIFKLPSPASTTTQSPPLEETPAQMATAMAGMGIASLLMIPLALAAADRLFRNGIRGLGLFRRPWRVSLAWGVVGLLVTAPIMWTLLVSCSWAMRELLPDYPLPMHDVLQVLREPNTGPAVAVWLAVTAGLIAPIWEELLFRGFIQTGFVRLFRSRWAGLVVTSILFGAVHVKQPQAVIPLAAFAMCLGIVYEKSGSLTAAIVMHSLFNIKNMLMTIASP